MTSSSVNYKIEQFQIFLKNLKGPSFDLTVSPVMEKRLEALLGKANSKLVLPIVGHSSHSIIGLVKSQKNSGHDSQPIIWLDSEGWPKCAFADSFESFLGLLPYGVGTIYDMITTTLFWLEDPEEVHDPNEKFTVDFFSDLLKERSKDDHQLAYLDWLINTMNLNIDNNPWRTTQDAVKKYQDLAIF